MSEKLAQVASHVTRIREISKLLDPESGPSQQRREGFDALTSELIESTDSIHEHMGKTMKAFASGLFAGGDALELPEDNLELERFFRLPKGHERRIHGHAHAGVRIVRRGSTLVPTLDAHRRHPEPFSAQDLAPWLDASEPEAQRDCTYRGRIMRQARSTKKRTALLEELERRYDNCAPET